MERMTVGSAPASLFARLQEETASARSRLRRPEASLAAVKQHLAWLLNARQGCSASSPELGLMDFNDVALGSTDLVLRISADIRRAIGTFEPRVQVHDVHYRPDPNAPLELHFRLACTVRTQAREEPIEIELVMNGRDRRTRVL
jgi:type VI secretion system protein